MGAHLSKEARPEPKIGTQHSSGLENGNPASPNIDHEEGTESARQHPSSSPVPIPSLPTSSSLPTVSESNEYHKDGDCPESPTTPDSSDGEEDLVTLLRKNRKRRRADEETDRGISRLSWKPINFRLRTRLETHENERQKPEQSTSPPKVRKRSRSVDSENRGDARAAKRRAQNPSTPDITKELSPQIAPRLLLSHDNEIKRSKKDNREQISDIQRVKHLRTTPNAINNNRLAPVQAAQRLSIHSDIKFVGSRVRQDGRLTAKIKATGEHAIHVQKQPKRSHTKKNNKLAPFRRRDRNVLAHPDSVRESNIIEEPQQSKHVVSKVDSGAILLDARPSTVSEPKVHTDGDANQLAPQVPAYIRHRPENFFQMLHDPVEGEALLEKQLQSRQRPPETVVPESKFAYTIKVAHSGDITPDNKEERGRVFADRKKANEYLDKITSPESVIGDLGTIVSRTFTLEGPQQLLKADIVMSNDEHHVLWVERSVVVLRNLKHEMRRQKQWKPNPRPKIPHYVVTCDLITYETSPVTRRDQGDDDDDDAVSLSSQDIGLGPDGTNVELRIEKLPPATFTFREMANKYAGKLFLETSKVTFPEHSDVLWWEYTALPKHKEAVAGARRPDGLYELAMDVDYMSARLGWNQILVHVHEVDDMSGPVNF